MKNRMNIMVIAIAVMIVAIVWIAARGQKTTIITTAAPSSAGPAIPAPPQELHIRVESVPAHVQAAPQPSALLAEQTAAAVPAAPSAPALAPVAKEAPNTSDTPAAKPAYTAVQGDTLSNVAAGLLGSDTKQNREAVMAANPSLQANPDRVLDGKTYVAPSPSSATAAPTASPAAAPQVVADNAASSNADKAPRADADRILKYTAQPGDSVSALAAGLLGADSKTNRDAIINENKSLQRDPNHVEAGKSYKIPAGEGLAAAPASATESAKGATTQPDADQLIQVGANRELRYVARAGDTVSKLAEVLLGSDTPENRDAIINNNATLKSDPDRVLVGQTYWIPAPSSPSTVK